MNTGVEILLQRMKDNPEDFYLPANPNRSVNRWSRLLEYAFDSQILTQEESDALRTALHETKRERFTELVMKELAGEGESEDPKHYTSPYLANVTHSGGVTLGAYSNTATATTTINANSLTLGNQTIDETTLAHMKAHIKAVQQESQRQKKQTLFGKLFNYT